MTCKKVITLILSVLISCCILHGCVLFDIGDVKDALLQNKELSAEDIYETVSASVVEITGETRTGFSKIGRAHV